MHFYDPTLAYTILWDLDLLHQDQTKSASSFGVHLGQGLDVTTQELTGSMFVPELRLRHLWCSDLGVVAECSEEVGSGQRWRLHHVERRKTTQSPTSLRRRPGGEATSHALKHSQHQLLVNDTDNSD